MIDPKGFDIKRGYPRPKKPATLDKDSPKKPEPDTEISLKDSRTFLLKFINREFLNLVVGDSGSIGQWIRLVIALMILALMVYNSIF